MESDLNPNVALKPPPLNSDQLNYLIWRYLQEAGYGEAAVKLQRDWKVEPENLPFARHIKGQALVSLVQKGLRYHHLSLTIDESGRPEKQPSPSTFFFGPDSGRPTTSSSARDAFFHPGDGQRALSPATNVSTASKKRDPDFNGPVDLTSAPAKRHRKTVTTDRNGNGVRKTSTSASDGPVPMELDHVNGNATLLRNMRSPSLGDNANDEGASNGIGTDSRIDVDMNSFMPGADGGAEASNEASETLLPLIHTLTNGESVGVQVAPAKVANLGPSTIILPLPDQLHVNRTAWRPMDGSLLTVAGDHFCGLWKGASANTHTGDSNVDYRQLLKCDDSSLITAVAWESDGGLLAVATYSSDQGGQLRFFDGRELILIETLPASQRAIAALKWIPSTLCLFGIVPYADQGTEQSNSSTILSWDFSNMQFQTSPLSLSVPELLLDLDSTHHAGRGVICTAGGSAVYHCHAERDSLVEKKWTTRLANEASWTFVRCASQRDDLVVVAAASETAQIWLPTKDVVRNDAHSASITGLEIRPRPFQTSDSDSIPYFATSSTDGTIKVWCWNGQTNSIDLMHRMTIGQHFPVMSLMFSPDGFCLAGASYGSVCIWNAEHAFNLMASWEGSSEEWRGTSLKDEDASSAAGLSSVNGEVGSLSTDHSLAWDQDSKRLAFGLASQVAVIDFQR